jgi:predicted protein tyrosine phosphatase
MNILFICSRNRFRSPTAEELFSSYIGIETASAGTSSDAETVLSADLVVWADVIFAMEATHKRRLSERFHSLLKNKKVIVLGIPDHYGFMEESLIDVLKSRVLPHLKLQQ